MVWHSWREKSYYSDEQSTTTCSVNSFPEGSRWKSFLYAPLSLEPASTEPQGNKDYLIKLQYVSPNYESLA